MSRREQLYPELSSLMGAYFNQDFDLYGETPDEVLAEYARTSSTDELTQVAGELDGLLATQTTGLLDRFEATVGPTDYMIAEDDEGARAWLAHTRDVLAKYIAKVQKNR